MINYIIIKNILIFSIFHSDDLEIVYLRNLNPHHL